MKRRDVLKGLSATAAASVTGLSLPALGQTSNKDVLKVAYESSLPSIDPIWTTANATNEFAFQVFDQLTACDEKFGVYPQMLEGWTLEDNGRTYVMTLREGLKFHNGEPVRSADCIASIARWSKRDGTGQAVAAFTESMTVRDDRTFVIRMKQPFAHLPVAMAKTGSSICAIMPEYLAKTDARSQIPEAIGSGPFRFLRNEYVHGSFVAFEKFEDYVPRSEPANNTAGGRRVHVKRMEWIVTDDQAAVLAAMQNGEYDYWPKPTPDLIPVARADPSLEVRVRTNNATYYTLVMNHLHPPFNNPAIRQAVAMAVNQQDYAQVLSGGDPSAAGVCPSYFMCGTPLASELGAEKLMSTDMDAAKAALAAAGYKGEKVLFMAPVNPPALGSVTQVTESLLRNLGFNVEFVAVDFATLAQRRTNKGPVEQGGWSIFNSTWGGSGLLDPLANSLLRGAGEDSWFGWPTNPRIEELRTAWLGETDPQKQLRLAHEMQLQGFQTLPYIPLAYSLPAHVWNKRLKGVFTTSALAFWNIEKT